MSSMNCFIGNKELLILEIFKKLVYKGNTYTVSNLGRVFLGEIELNIRENADGYLVVTTLDFGEQYRSVGVHRLVGFAFLENDDPINKNEINHKDYNRKNNHDDNLEWVTHADNVRYSVCNKPNMAGSNNPNYGNKKLSKYYAENPDMAIKKQSRTKLQNGRCRKIKIYKDEELVKSFDYIVDCLKYIKDNISPDASLDSIRGQIDKCVRNNKTYKGYKFIKE